MSKNIQRDCHALFSWKGSALGSFCSCHCAYASAIPTKFKCFYNTQPGCVSYLTLVPRWSQVTIISSFGLHATSSSSAALPISSLLPLILHSLLSPCSLPGFISLLNPLYFMPLSSETSCLLDHPPPFTFLYLPSFLSSELNVDMTSKYKRFLTLLICVCL